MLRPSQDLVMRSSLLAGNRGLPMVVSEIRKSSACPFEAGLGRLTAAVGTSRFISELAGLAHDSARSELVTILTIADQRTVPSLTVASASDSSSAERAASPYVRSHWRSDPSNIFLGRSLSSSLCYAVELSENEALDPAHRRDCYTATGIKHQLSLIRVAEKSCWKVTLHRRQSGDWSAREVQPWVDHFDLVVGLVGIHATRHPAHRMGSEAASRFAERVGNLCPALSGREREVCGLICVGATSAVIAARLGVSPNTVLTFRRTAYAKLGICTQGDLLRLLL